MDGFHTLYPAFFNLGFESDRFILWLRVSDRGDRFDASQANDNVDRTDVRRSLQT